MPIQAILVDTFWVAPVQVCIYTHTHTGGIQVVETHVNVQVPINQRNRAEGLRRAEGAF